MPRQPTPQRRPRTPTLTPDDELLTVLERARTVGFLGPGPLRVHLEHARCYGSLIPHDARSLIDLGSGGGLPGLPLLVDRPSMTCVLLDAAAKRTAFLVWATIELGLDDRVEVVTERAEIAAHRPKWRERFDVVVGRGFGPPSVTLECAAGFVCQNGRVLISEPPERRRWNNTVLESIGLRHVVTEEGVARFDRTGPLPGSIPRATNKLRRDPLEVVSD